MREKESGIVLYEKYLAGDHSALASLVEEYAASLLLFINRYVNNLSVAEELMEDTFSDLVLMGKRFKGESSFKTYLFAIGKNKASDYIRRASRYGFVPIEDVQREIADLQTLEEAVVKEEEKRELWRAMNDLNEDYRAVLYLVYFEDLSYDEAGRVLKRSRSQIKNLVFRAKSALREKLEKGGFVYEGI